MSISAINENQSLFPVITIPVSSASDPQWQENTRQSLILVILFFLFGPLGKNVWRASHLRKSFKKGDLQTLCTCTSDLVSPSASLSHQLSTVCMFYREKIYVFRAA